MILKLRSKLSAALRRRPIQIAAIVVVAAAAGLVVWLAIGNDESEQQPQPRASGATSATVPQLRTLARSVGHRIYWVGRRKSYTYEVTRTTAGDVYVRYLSPGARVGDKRPIFLTVGTYPRHDAIAAVRAIARTKQAVSRRTRHRGLAAAARSKRESVYLAYPRSNLLVEVYDPSPARALRLASSGRVVPVR